jgi:predicted nuclease with TOPRIM domain
MDKTPYDSAPIYMMVRQRDHDLRDRVQKLMPREEKLETAIAKAEASATQLKAAIEQVLKIPADASELQRMAKNASDQLARDREALAAIKNELALVREAMKYADMAHEALHWARFADQALERFDRERSETAGQLQEAV